MKDHPFEWPALDAIVGGTLYRDFDECGQRGPQKPVGESPQLWNVTSNHNRVWNATLVP